MRIYLDAGVYIAAWRDPALARMLFERLRGESVVAIASSLIRLEIEVKPRYLRHSPELDFYRRVFELISVWEPIHDELILRAIALGGALDVVNLDALHLAAAERAGADVFLTTERRGRPLYRAPSPRVVHLDDQANG